MTPDLSYYDRIVLNSSAGKDSQAMIDFIVELAREQGVMDRLVVVHCDLGRVEWKGTRELAEEQAKHYGLRFEVVSRPLGDLLDQVEERKMWPSSKMRYCTSDHKRAQVYKVLTRLTEEVRAVWTEGKLSPLPPVRILNCLGIRAQESPARAKKSPLGLDKMASNGKREVTTWYPIFDWTKDQVWARIKQSGVRHHRAYDLGMPRLSCVFCVMASKDALLLSAMHNPALLDTYVALEQKIGHEFKHHLPIAGIKQALANGERPKAVIKEWCM